MTALIIWMQSGSHQLKIWLLKLHWLQSGTCTTLICGDSNQGIWIQSGTYTNPQNYVSKHGWLKLISNATAPQVVHVPLCVQWFIPGCSIIWKQSGTYNHPLGIKSHNMADKELIQNCTDSQVVHVPLWYSAILARTALSFKGQVVHIPHAQNYVKENGCISKWYMYHFRFSSIRLNFWISHPVRRNFVRGWYTYHFAFKW